MFVYMHMYKAACCHVNIEVVRVLRAIDGFARSIDGAAPSMDPLIAHYSVDCAIIDRSRDFRNCAIDELRTVEFAQSIDRAAIESTTLNKNNH